MAGGGELNPPTVKEVNELLAELGQFALRWALDRAGKWHRPITGFQNELNAAIR